MADTTRSGDTSTLFDYRAINCIKDCKTVCTFQDRLQLVAPPAQTNLSRQLDALCSQNCRVDDWMYDNAHTKQSIFFNELFIVVLDARENAIKKYNHNIHILVNKGLGSYDVGVARSTVLKEMRP